MNQVRELEVPVRRDVGRKMVLLSGPRQVGKTTLARETLSRLFGRLPLYLTWDNPDHRSLVRRLGWDRSAPGVVLDEIHKHPGWKQLLKGFFDTEGGRQKVIVTGSSRLDVYIKGGESLMGRYFGFRLHPFSIGEIARGGRPPRRDALLRPAGWADQAPLPKSGLETLMTYGGFPEPFLAAHARAAGRWRLARRNLVLREEMRDLTFIRHLSLVEQLVDLVRERVGTPLSLQSLCETLSVDHKTVANWIAALERLYVVFRVLPYSGSLSRTFRKEAKAYLWDWSEAPEGGPRFENLVASHLLKLCHWLEDVEGVRAELRYVRDREKREVDFLVLKEGRPWFLAEAKMSADPRFGPLPYFHQRLKTDFAVQVVARGIPARDIVPADRFFAGLP